ncbi:MAG: GntR family transcriptional regulator [Acidobacteriaceae bacterium]|nr:GntR family transcriptional regulator [Acidobacteriaceae bacterium]
MRQIQYHAYYRLSHVQLWFARNGCVPVRDQLATQLMLAIASGELAPGAQLPSTRALAKRFGLNPNTVSAAYHQLEGLGWVESIHGSGVYVRRKGGEIDTEVDLLDRLVLAFIRAAQSAGLSAKAVRDRIDYWLKKRPSRFVFVHPEQEMRAIVCYELRQAIGWKVEACAQETGALGTYVGDSIFITVPSNQSRVRALIPSESDLVPLQVTPVARALAHYLPVPTNVLLAVVSGWSGFLEIAKSVLSAAGIDSDAVVLRDTKADGWNRGLDAASVVLCDAVTANLIPNGPRKVVFSVVSDASIARLRALERYFSE